MTLLQAQIEGLRAVEPRRISGAVTSMRGLTLLVDDLPLPVGTLVRIEGKGIEALRHGGIRVSGVVDESLHASMPPCLQALPLRGEVIGFEGPRSVVMLLGQHAGIAPGAVVVGEQAARTVQVGRALLGRVIDGLGRVIDGKPRPIETVPRPLDGVPTAALRRRRIAEPLPTGVRVLDAMLTLGRGQRVGIFSGPGVGKSTLVGSIARNTAADVNVIGLIGERGREVRDFIEHALGPEGLRRSVVVVATGDESPLLRVRAALVAATVAEHFRAEGADVMLMIDSITRFAQAQRQVGLAVGEQPATRGYTPSVFAMLPILLERAGALEGGGSITGLYAVLVEGDDINEPVSDAARGVLDGHIALSRRLASRGHFPAVDVLNSISRVADDVCDRNHVAARRQLLRLLAAYGEAEELINIGAYANGSNPECDAAIALRPAINQLLQQSREERAGYPQTCRALIDLAAAGERELAQRGKASRAAKQSA